MIWGIWHPDADKHWYHMDSEIWFSEHKSLAEAQAHYVRMRFADSRWQARVIGEDGRPIEGYYQSNEPPAAG